ncbi:hypothetical protein CS078_15940 [Pseudomonas prosekii]|uniref:Antitoxin Xre/MbcA/ParS-like toxin-binding domain-containing protein n=1 Tax=Pseudomonas prosekii TaxID=1148509 RepID=A0A3L8CKI3_9PSED|nr:MbcA/ParS/Xre antitoxin family protein [Pseudomonas prosekii]RLU08381.1 hypothetical protein CS078_15940 [Pseudomonas prosekii]RLU11768.1 hypothetical protein CS076_08950 [Pseudomonas prosekii]
MDYVESIQNQAERVFGNKNKANAWLNQPKVAFGDNTPLQAIQKRGGYELVKAELEKISQGYVC